MLCQVTKILDQPTYHGEEIVFLSQLIHNDIYTNSVIYKPNQGNNEDEYTKEKKRLLKPNKSYTDTLFIEIQ